MLAQFIEWWVRQMRSLLPAGLWPAATEPDARIIAIDHLNEIDDGRPAGVVLLRRKGLETAVAALNLDQAVSGEPAASPAGLPTALRLPFEHILSREIMLPLAAARNVETVVGFQLDQLTPFAPDELFWGVGAIGRVDGRLNVQLFFVLRAQVENLLQKLRRVGVNPSFIEIGHGMAGRIDLTSEHRPAGRWADRSRAALCAVLAAACLISPFLRQQMAQDAAGRRIAAIAPAAAAAEALRRQLDIAASGQAAIANARRSGDALQVLASLTDALPDGTWLNDLALKSGDLTFDGRSADAAALIGRLSAVSGLKDPSFTAPVTRTADGSADEFSIHATVQE